MQNVITAPTRASRYVTGLCLVWLIVSCISIAGGQPREGPLRLFGYYQNSFQYSATEIARDNSTFLTQQLNVVFQKDLAARLRSFVNFEFLNTFESSLGWGSAALKEAWVRFDTSPQLKFKLGLQIPVFNHLNDIKTRTPLLPYIIRPIVYETSLEEIISIEDFVPERAFVQVYGSLPAREGLSVDYVVFAGNSPNVNDDSDYGQTGVDTTTAILVGARAGLRWDNQDSDLYEVRAGFSSTFDRVNRFVGAADLLSPDSARVAEFAGQLDAIGRWRIGADLGVYWRQWYVHAEFISVLHRERTVILDVDKFFVYGTLGFTPADRFEAYTSYWRTKETGLLRDRRFNPLFLLDQKISLDVFTMGIKYSFTPRLVGKAQYAIADLDNREDLRSQLDAPPGTSRTDLGDVFSVYSIALSVFF